MRSHLGTPGVLIESFSNSRHSCPGLPFRTVWASSFTSHSQTLSSLPYTILVALAVRCRSYWSSLLVVVLAGLCFAVYVEVVLVVEFHVVRGAVRPLSPSPPSPGLSPCTLVFLGRLLVSPLCRRAGPPRNDPKWSRHAPRFQWLVSFAAALVPALASFSSSPRSWRTREPPAGWPWSSTSTSSTSLERWSQHLAFFSFSPRGWCTRTRPTGLPLVDHLHHLGHPPLCLHCFFWRVGHLHYTICDPSSVPSLQLEDGSDRGHSSRFRRPFHPSHLEHIGVRRPV